MAGRTGRLAGLLTTVFVLACHTGAPRVGQDPGFAPIPNASLRTQTGASVRFYDDLVRGRTVVIQFFFVHCEGICPLSTGRMVALQDLLGERLGRDVHFLSITLDPEQDTPAVLAEHARAVGARAGWTFLTGARDDIEALRRRLGVFDLDPALDADRNQHAGVLVLGNDSKQRWTMKPASLPASTLLQSILRLAADPGARPSGTRGSGPVSWTRSAPCPAPRPRRKAPPGRRACARSDACNVVRRPRPPRSRDRR